MQVTDKELRTGEVAAMHGVAPSTVWRWIAAGKLRATLVGSQRRILESDAQAMRHPITTGEPQ